MNNATVLVVDDDATIVTMLEAVLHAGGYHVVTADGRDAVEVAQAHQPDVILLDLMMPHLPGMAVSERLRANPLTAPIPIIVMSAQTNLAIFAPHLPVDDQLPKPFEVPALYAMVARWVTRR